MGLLKWIQNFGEQERCEPFELDAETRRRLGLRVAPNGETITEGMYTRNGKICYSWSAKAQARKDEEAARKAAKEAIKAKLRDKAEAARLEQEALAELEAEQPVLVTVFNPTGKVGTPRYVAYVCPHAALSSGVLIVTRNGKLAVPRHYRRMYRALVEAERIVTSTATDCEDAEVDLSSLDPSLVRNLTRARKASRPVLL